MKRPTWDKTWPLPVIADTPPTHEPPDVVTPRPHEHRWQLAGATAEGWLFWIAQSCECGETRQVRTSR